MKNPTTEELAAFDNECWDALDAWDAEHDVENLSIENVVDELEVFGAFGAVHEEPIPQTPLELQVAADFADRKTFYDGE